MKLIHKDRQHDHDGNWTWCAIFCSDTPLLIRIDSADFERSMLERCEQEGIQVSPEGGEGPGRPFAREPWVWVIGQTVIVTQTGGRDV